MLVVVSCRICRDCVNLMTENFGRPAPGDVFEDGACRSGDVHIYRVSIVDLGKRRRQMRVILIATLFLMPMSAVAAAAVNDHPAARVPHPLRHKHHPVVLHQPVAPVQPVDGGHDDSGRGGGGKY
jgi:hypothetical protein